MADERSEFEQAEAARWEASRQWSYRVLPTLTFMAKAMTYTPPAPPEKRCMGRRCPREAVLLLTVIDATKGAHEYPVRLCQTCCNPAIDIFRWLSDCRIEATSFGGSDGA